MFYTFAMHLEAVHYLADFLRCFLLSHFSVYEGLSCNVRVCKCSK